MTTFFILHKAFDEPFIWEKKELLRSCKAPRLTKFKKVLMKYNVKALLT